MKRKHIYINYSLICSVILTILIASSCTSPSSSKIVQPGGKSYPAVPFEDYKLQYNDEVYCSILTNQKEFSEVFNGTVSIGTSSNRAVYTISETGNLQIPIFGEVHIVNMTIPEAEDAIQNSMRKAIPDAQVRVSLRNNYYYIVSEQQNGRFEVYKDNMTIYQALAMTGMPNSRLSYDNVKIIRKNELGESTVKTFDLRHESIIESEFYYLKPNDLIYYSTSNRSFFQIDSFTSVFSVILAPVSLALTILSFTVNK